jgi:outer membrane receptor protein involved in Fe transport
LRCFWVLAFLCAACGAVPSVFAQQSVDLASVSGRVTDPSGAAVPGARITARQTQTNQTSTAVSDQEGRFRLPYLRVGPCEIVVRQQGFRDTVRYLTLTVGAAFELPVTLTVGAVDTTVTVTGDATVLEAARSQIASTVSEAEVRSLPMNGRNFLELALLVPGVSPTNVASTQLFPETSAVPGVSLSVGSQRNLSNNFIVDGLSANDDAAGLSGITYGVDAVEQFQVVTSGAQAELGRALGGYINVVTKSGTNVLHGTMYNYLRDDRLNTENALSQTKLPMDQAQYGGSLGGPLVANRTFYFANVEQRRLDQTGLTTISDLSASAANARLAAVSYQGPLIATGVYPNPVDSTNLLGKVDHRVSGRDQLSIRYSLYDVGAKNARGAGGLNAPSASTALDSRDQTIALSNTFTISSRTVLETRAQFAHSDLKAPATDPVGPAVSIAGIASFGTSSGSPTRRVNNLYQMVNNLSHQAGAHALRAGVDFLYNDTQITYPRSVRGSYTFSSLATFLAGTYNNAGFTQTFGVSDVSQTNPNVGVYAQDEWKLSPRITLNLGLRYDLQFLETINRDTNNISPRLGFAWMPFDSRKTLVRGSGGLFYDRVPLRALANAILSAGNTTDLANLRQIGVSLSPTQVGAPAFPNILTDVVPSVTLVNLTTMDRNLQNAYSRQASVEVEQQLGERATVSAGYQYLRGLNLLMSVNQNVPSCVSSGNNNGCRPNPNYANNSQYSSVGESNYHGLHLSFMQRPARWGHYRVSYTLATSRNNLGAFFFSSPIDPLDLAKDWGRSDDDQRHRLVVNGTVQTSMEPATTTWEYLKNGFQVSGMLQAYSRLPFNITSGVTTVQGTAGRPVVNGEFIERNAGVGSDFFNVTLRVSRAFRLTGRVHLEALVEGFNLTNHINVLTRNTNFGPGAYPTNPSATFNQITAVAEPRSFQLGARLRF